MDPNNESNLNENRQNVDQNKGHNISQNVDQNVSQSVDQNVSHNVDQNVSHNVDQNVSQNVDQNVSQNVDQNVSQNVYQNASQKVYQNVDQNVYHNVSQNNQNVSQSTNQNVNQYRNENLTYQYQDGVYRGYQAPIQRQVVYQNQMEAPKQKRKRKKGAFKKVVRFTAAALIFGILAGGISSAYDYVDRNRRLKEYEEQIEKLQEEALANMPVKEETDTPSLIPASVSIDGIVSDVSDVVEKVMPSIVAINSSSVVARYDIFGRRFNEPIEGSGSGIIIAQNTDSILILTNNHVIEGAKTVEIVFADDTTADATVKGTDPSSDLAVVQVRLNDISDETLGAIRVATLGDSDTLKAGQMAIAIGNALGYGQSVTVGYISAVDREVSVDNFRMDLLQTDAAINPGNSGGALINSLGELIGINSIKFASTDVEGMGYAIPISDAIPIINQLMNREILHTDDVGFLGVNLQTAKEVIESHALQFNMPIGVYINDVVEDSPAEKAGIKSGYIITKIDGIKIETIDELISTIAYYRAGSEVTVTVQYLHDGAYVEKNLDIVLSARP